jgi:hypothetical protein
MREYLCFAVDLSCQRIMIDGAKISRPARTRQAIPLIGHSFLEASNSRYDTAIIGSPQSVHAEASLFRGVQSRDGRCGGGYFSSVTVMTASYAGFVSLTGAASGVSLFGLTQLHKPR